MNANALLHWVHLNGRSFKCTERLCFDKLPFSPNALPHSSHLNERSFRCTVLMCFLRSALCAKQWPHCVHVFRTIRDCTFPPFGGAEVELSRKFTSSLLGAILASTVFRGVDVAVVVVALVMRSSLRELALLKWIEFQGSYSSGEVGGIQYRSCSHCPRKLRKVCKFLDPTM